MVMVKFTDENIEIHYGIKLEDEDTIMCACCGGTFSLEDVTVLDTYEGNLEEIIKNAMGK